MTFRKVVDEYCSLCDEHVWYCRCKMETYIRTLTPHVWYNTAEGTYTFEDETSNFCGIYSTEEAARDALEEYCKEYL